LGGRGTVEATVVVRNRSGLHARPSSVLAEAALKYPGTTVRIRRGDVEVDAKSIMELLLLAAPKGTELTLAATGPEAEEAIRAIRSLFEREFGLEY
jgi:phosphocarrier protein